MEMVAVRLNTNRGMNNLGEIIGLTPPAAQRLCSEALTSGGTAARLATPEEVAASRGGREPTKSSRKIQVRLLRDYGNNSTADDPWYPEREALALVERGTAIRIPGAEPEPEPEPDKRLRRKRRGPVSSPAKAINEPEVEK